MRLEADFFEEENFQAIKDSYAEGAPGPNGFSFLFYQKFCPIIKKDIMALCKGFERGEVIIGRLNCAMIVLIPRKRVQDP
jgi:hypothetical protein